MAMTDRSMGMLLTVLLLAAALAGCAGFQARSAFEEAEQLFQEEQYDAAGEQYYSATQDDRGNKPESDPDDDGKPDEDGIVTIEHPGDYPGTRFH